MGVPTSSDPYLAAASRKNGCPPKGQPHGVIVPGSKRPGYTAVYRHHTIGVGELPKTVDPSITTMWDAFSSAVVKYPDNNCLGWREQDAKSKKWGPYQWIDYKTVYNRSTNFGAGLVRLHQQAGVTEKHVPIGLWSQNRPEWQLSDIGCMSQSLYSVSIYDTLGPDTAVYIINHAELTTVVASLAHIPTLLSTKDQCPSFKIVICMDPLVGEGEAPGDSKKAILSAWAAEKGVGLYTMAEVEAMGEKSGLQPNPPCAEDVITINYTSGTTGFPKGVLLTHGNAIAAASCAMSSCMYQMEDDVMLSYLPLAHIYARIAENTALWGGAAIGFLHGNIAEVLEDIKALRPTTFFSVPRLFNRIYNAILEATVAQGGIKGALSRHALATKLEHMKTSGSNTHGLYDHIWANKIRIALGFDRCRGMVSGSAPIAPDVLQTLRVIFGNNIIEGYGMTETYAVVLGQLVQDNSAGNCGPPSIANECKLRDVPEMGYTSTDSPHPRGELLVRGHTIFKGYYKNPTITAESFDSEGWFATGDICHVDSLGRFSIIDRVKNLLKLAQGEYVSPEKIENEYLANFPVFAQGLAYGDSFQSFLVGVFGIDPTHFADFAAKVLKRSISPTDTAAIEEACADKKVRLAVLEEMERIAKRVKLQGFERIKNIHLCIDPFTLEEDLLTPTLKMKRIPAIKRYKEILDALYEETNRENPQKAKL